MNGIQEVSGSIPLISTKRLEILRFQASFFVFATIFNGFWIFIFPRFVHKCESVIPTHRVQGIETNAFPCTRYLGLDVDFPLHLINPQSSSTTAKMRNIPHFPVTENGQPAGCPTYLSYHFYFSLSIRMIPNFSCGNSAILRSCKSTDPVLSYRHKENQTRLVPRIKGGSFHNEKSK